jgi:hypothetical protein
LSLKINDILNAAAQEIGVLGQGDTLSAYDQALALQKCNDILDEWAARKAYVYNDAFLLFTLTANHAPHLIGPNLTSPDFAVTQRPVRIEGWDLVLSNLSPVVDLPRTRMRDSTWWTNQRVKSLASNVPTDLYYEPDFPNGQLNFWPVPNFAYQVRLQVWNVINQFALGQVFNLPPGYRRALTLTLAKDLCGPFRREWTETQAEGLAKAIKAILGNNDESPRMATAEPGQQGRGSGKRADFNWMDGSVV